MLIMRYKSMCNKLSRINYQKILWTLNTINIIRKIVASILIGEMCFLFRQLISINDVVINSINIIFFL